MRALRGEGVNLMIYTDPTATQLQRNHLAQILAIDWTQPEPVGQSQAWAKQQREQDERIDEAKAKQRRKTG